MYQSMPEIYNYSIHFPDTNAAPSKRSTVYITGEIEAVCRAREQIMVS